MFTLFFVNYLKEMLFQATLEDLDKVYQRRINNPNLFIISNLLSIIREQWLFAFHLLCLLVSVVSVKIKKSFKT